MIPERKSKIKYIDVHFLRDTPHFEGVDGWVYGPYDYCDVDRVPEEDAEWLTRHGFAEETALSKEDYLEIRNYFYRLLKERGVMYPAKYEFLLLRELDHRAGKDINRRIAERVAMNIVMMRELERIPLRRKRMRHLAREEAERLFDEFLNELGYTRIQYEALDEFTKNQLRRSFVQWLDARRRRQKGDKNI